MEPMRWLPLADPGGALLVRAPPPPQQDPILSFLHMFLPKSTHVGGRHPPQQLGAPPNGKSWICHWLHSVVLIFMLYLPLQSTVDNAHCTIAAHRL